MINSHQALHWEAWKFISSAPSDFDPRIKNSISAIGEFLSHSVHSACNSLEIGLEICPVARANDFYLTGKVLVVSNHKDREKE